MQQRHECEAGVLADEACFARCARPTAGLPGRGSRPWLLICQLFRMRAHAPIACSASVPLPPPPPLVRLQRDCLYVADTEAHALREIDLRRKTVTTLAGAPGSARHAPPSLYPACSGPPRACPC